MMSMSDSVTTPNDGAVTVTGVGLPSHDLTLFTAEQMAWLRATFVWAPGSDSNYWMFMDRDHTLTSLMPAKSKYMYTCAAYI